jgi:hypothetical protein
MDAESSQACMEDAEPIRSVTCSREERHVLQLCAQPTHCEREDRPRAVASVTAMRRCRSARPSWRDPAPAPAVSTVRFSHKPIETLLSSLYAYSVVHCSLSRPQMCKRIHHNCQKSGETTSDIAWSMVHLEETPGGAHLRYPASASLSNEERRPGGAISGASGRLQAGLARRLAGCV